MQAGLDLCCVVRVAHQLVLVALATIQVRGPGACAGRGNSMMRAMLLAHFPPESALRSHGRKRQLSESLGAEIPQDRRNSGVVTHFFCLFPSARCGGLSAPVAHWQSPVGATSGVIGRGLCGVEHCRRPLPRFCMCVCVLQLSICIYLYLSHSRLTTTKRSLVG